MTTPFNASKLNGNTFNRNLYSHFDGPATVPPRRAKVLYEASLGISTLAHLLSVQADEEVFLADGSDTAYPLNAWHKDGLLCALRACAHLVETEVLMLKDADSTWSEEQLKK